MDVKKEVMAILDQVLWTSGASDDNKRILAGMIADRINLRAMLPNFDEMAAIGQNILTQDNRITDQPLFAVQRLEKIITDGDYHHESSEWVEQESGDYRTASKSWSRKLDKKERRGDDTGKWKKLYFYHEWQFVTGCFTEEGCKEHIRINGHNLGVTQIYAYGSFRNTEYQTVRKFLIGLAGGLE